MVKKTDDSLRGTLFETIFYILIKIIPYSLITKLMALGVFINKDISLRYSIAKRRKQVFGDIAAFIEYSEIKGDYFEFGCHSAFGLSIFFKQIKNRKLKQMRFFAFDSFEGFPEISDIDKYHHYYKGMLKYSHEDFRKVLKVNRMSEVISFKGFFDAVLTDDLKTQNKIFKAAIIFIDCDLYISTKPTLKFIRSLLQTGTIVIFDDYWLFRGDKNRGVQKALSEFQQMYPYIQFNEYLYPYSPYSKIFLINIE